MHIAKIEDKLEVFWCEDVKAIHDKWLNYGVTLEEFQQGVVVSGYQHAKANRAIAWIADGSDAKGVFSQEIQDLIAQKVFKAFVGIGIRYFISVQPKSALTKLGVKRYESQLGPHGIQLITVESLEGAFAFLNAQARAVG